MNMKITSLMKAATVLLLMFVLAVFVWPIISSILMAPSAPRIEDPVGKRIPDSIDLSDGINITEALEIAKLARIPEYATIDVGEGINEDTKLQEYWISCSWNIKAPSEVTILEVVPETEIQQRVTILVDKESKKIKEVIMSQ